jgi:hypothetical protein
VDHLAGGSAHGLFIEQDRSANERVDNERGREGGIEPPLPVALVVAARDAPAEVKNAAWPQERDQPRDRRRDGRARQMHDHGLAQHIGKTCIRNPGKLRQCGVPERRPG